MYKLLLISALSSQSHSHVSFGSNEDDILQTFGQNEDDILPSSQEHTSLDETRLCGYVSSREECLPCSQIGVTYSSVVIKTVDTIRNVEECRSLCQLDYRCKYFSLDTRRGLCRLKSSINQSIQAPDSIISGPRYCDDEEINEISHDTIDLTKDVVRTAAPTFSAANFGRRGSGDPAISGRRGSRELDLGLNGSYPVVLVEHGTQGYSTLLAGVPATFGLNVTKGIKVRGKVVFAQPMDLCNNPKNMRMELVGLRMKLSNDLKLIGIVKRGMCTFSTKAENALADGFDGIIILDNLENTSVKFILGNNKEKLKNFPVVFMRKTEADILEKLVLKNGAADTIITIQDSTSVNWYNLNSTTSTTTTTSSSTTTAVNTTTRSSTIPILTKGSDGFVVGMYRPYITKKYYTQTTQAPPTPTTTPTSRGKSSMPRLSIKVDMAGGNSNSIIHLTPLTVGSLIGALVLALFLIIAVLTLVVGKIRKSSRLRENHNRCKAALSEMSGRLGADNIGFEESGLSLQDQALPKSVKYLFECPVCLDFAWPPRKIFQCREGHIICELCYGNQQLQTCPICRIPIRGPGQVSRNRQLEELAAALKAAEHPSFNPADPQTDTSDANIPSAPPQAYNTSVIFHGNSGDSGNQVEPYEEIESLNEAGPLTVILPPEWA